MSLTISKEQGFRELQKDFVDFINYVSEKSHAPFTFEKQSDLEAILNLLERFLKAKSRGDADTQLLLYKVLKAKKLLKKLREC